SNQGADSRSCAITLCVDFLEPQAHCVCIDTRILERSGASGVFAQDAIIGAPACALLGVAAWRLFSKRAGLIAGIGLALYTSAILWHKSEFQLCAELQQASAQNLIRLQPRWPVRRVLRKNRTRVRQVVNVEVGLNMAFGGLERF